MYALWTGCQWNALPKVYGSGKTVHRYFQKWARAGVFRRMWQAGGSGKRPTGDDQGSAGGEKTGKNPTDCAKQGVKRSMLVNGNGVPLSIVVSGANTADSKLLESPLDDMAVERPDPQAVAQHLCLDKGYSGEPCRQVAQAHGCELHVPDKEDAKKRKRTPGRRKPRR